MKRSLGFILISLSLVFSACTKKQNSTEYGLDIKETLRINLQQEPPSLDWSKATDTTSALVVLNMMDGLVDYNLNDPELAAIPALASEWSSAENAKKWTFTLRKDVKWSDGVDFTAQHVIDGWERLLNPATASEYAYFLFGIKNAKAYNEGKVKDFSQVGVAIDKEGKLQIELEQAQSYFPYLLTHHSTYPLRKDVVQKFGDKWTAPENIVTLGAYKLKVWEHDKAIVLERNDGYYGEKAKTKYVLAYMINELSTALNLFDSGKLDVQSSLPSREIGQLRKRPEYKEKGTLGTYYFGMNTKKAPFDNVKVRSAFNHAINRKEITDLLAGGQVPLTSWIPAGMFGYEAERGIKFDVEKAKQLLDEAGYADRTKLPKVTLAFNTNEDHQRIAENIQAQISKNLGINIELKNEEWKVYLSSLRSDTPQIYRMGWVADFPDPDNFMNLMTSYSENNHTKWGSPKYDELISKAVSITTKDERRGIYSEAQKILAEIEVPVIPIYSRVSQELVSSRVVNYPLNAMERQPLKGVSLK